MSYISGPIGPAHFGGKIAEESEEEKVGRSLVSQVLLSYSENTDELQKIVHDLPKS